MSRALGGAKRCRADGRAEERLRLVRKRGMCLKGSCLCGAVRYQVEQLDMPIAHCHCVTCRKAHAAAYASTAGVMREHFRWGRGREAIRL